jgi:hypothetical protein
MTLEQCAVVVTSRQQPLEVTAGTETKIVEEGQSYRVMILEGPCSAERKRPPLSSGKNSRFWLITLIGAGVAAFVPLMQALESPDRP